MRESNHALRYAIAVAVAVGILSFPLRGHAQSAAVTHIQSYYQQLMPTIQQAGRLSVRERDKRFTPAITSDYASQVKDYSGESFVVDPKSVPEPRGGGEIVKTKLLQPGGRTVTINYLVRGGKVIDVYLNGTISDLATRRDEFASIIASGGAEGLIKRLNDRTQKLLAG
jgi:phospholipid transport system substrate-binding protein